MIKYINYENPRYQKKKSKRWRFFCWMWAVVFILGGLLFGCWWLNETKAENYYVAPREELPVVEGKLVNYKYVNVQSGTSPQRDRYYYIYLDTGERYSIAQDTTEYFRRSFFEAQVDKGDTVYFLIDENWDNHIVELWCNGKTYLYYDEYKAVRESVADNGRMFRWIVCIFLASTSWFFAGLIIKGLIKNKRRN